jgi:hypothetical protein
MPAAMGVQLAQSAAAPAADALSVVCGTSRLQPGAGQHSAPTAAAGVAAVTLLGSAAALHQSAAAWGSSSSADEQEGRDRAGLLVSLCEALLVTLCDLPARSKELLLQ